MENIQISRKNPCKTVLVCKVFVEIPTPTRPLCHLLPCSSRTSLIFHYFYSIFIIHKSILNIVSMINPVHHNIYTSFWIIALVSSFLPCYARAGTRTRRLTKINDNVAAFVPSVYCGRSRYEQRRKKVLFSSSSDRKNNDELSLEEQSYKSWSTASPDASCKFHEGSDERKERLDDELMKIGVIPNDFLESSEYQGCSALRTYSSFILPKSEGALAMTSQPRRAAVVANNIAFLLKEHRSHREEWLRNHDRSLEETKDSERKPIILIMDNIRSAANIGNILRAAEAAKCSSVMLCGSMTPAPPNKKVLKTAMGAAEFVPHEVWGSTLQAVQKLKSEKVKIIGVETTSRSVPLWDASFFKEDGDKVAFIFGNEMIGVDTQCLEECDELISLPTHGVKNSLNVATCASVVIWEALRQHQEIDK